MCLRPLLAAMVLLIGPEAFAQDAPVSEADMLAHLRACYAAGDGIAAREACMFKSSQMCQDAEEGGGSTLGMTTCNHAETMAWDVLLNEEYQATMAWAKAFDADDSHSFPEFANREATLREAQRAWITYRDAECGLQYAIWGAGSMRHISGTACMLRETAERTIELWVIREEY